MAMALEYLLHSVSFQRSLVRLVTLGSNLRHRRRGLPVSLQNSLHGPPCPMLLLVQVQRSKEHA